MLIKIIQASILLSAQAAALSVQPPPSSGKFFYLGTDAASGTYDSFPILVSDEQEKFSMGVSLGEQTLSLVTN